MRGGEGAALVKAGRGAGGLSGRANRHRGEVEAVIGGERRILCLTLGALAELETAFAAESLTALAERFSGGRLKAGDIIHLLAAGLRGGGNLVDEEDVAVMAIEGGVPAAIAIVTDLLLLTFQPAAAEAGVGEPDTGERDTSQPHTMKPDTRQPRPRP